MPFCCQISPLFILHSIIQFFMILSGLLVNGFSYQYSEERAWNPTIIFWVCGRHFLPAGCLLMWKQAHFTFKSTSVFAWIEFLLQLGKSGWPKGLTNKYVCYVFILLNMEIGKHKVSFKKWNKAPNMPQNETHHRFKTCSKHNFLIISFVVRFET